MSQVVITEPRAPSRDVFSHLSWLLCPCQGAVPQPGSTRHCSTSVPSITMRGWACEDHSICRWGDDSTGRHKDRPFEMAPGPWLVAGCPLPRCSGLWGATEGGPLHLLVHNDSAQSELGQGHDPPGVWELASEELWAQQRGCSPGGQPGAQLLLLQARRPAAPSVAPVVATSQGCSCGGRGEQTGKRRAAG